MEKSGKNTETYNFFNTQIIGFLIYSMIAYRYECQQYIISLAQVRVYA